MHPSMHPSICCCSYSCILLGPITPSAAPKITAWIQMVSATFNVIENHSSKSKLDPTHKLWVLKSLRVAEWWDDNVSQRTCLARSLLPLCPCLSFLTWLSFMFNDSAQCCGWMSCLSAPWHSGKRNFRSFVILTMTLSWKLCFAFVCAFLCMSAALSVFAMRGETYIYIDK